MSFLTNRNGVSLSVSTNIALSSVPLSYRLAPSLLLDFTNTNTLDSRITFTRASTATFTGSNGLLQTAAIDAPRFDYNPTTLASLGLLIEEQRANLLLQSQNFTTTWVNTGTTDTANTEIAPDGTTTADTITATAGTASHAILQIITPPTGPITVSVFAKEGTAKYLQIFLSTQSGTFANFNLTSGAGVIGTSGGIISSSITDVGNGWYRCVMVFTQVNGSAVQFAIADSASAVRAASFNAAGTETVYLWGAQLEAGAFPTSYIPTVASQVTRSADVAVMTGTNFSSWYNNAEGTLYAEYAAIFNTNREVLDLNDGTTNNRVQIRIASGSQAQFAVAVGGTNQVNIAPAGYSTIGQTYKRAIALKVDDFSQVIDGVVTGTDSLGSLPSVDRMFIGVNLSTGGGVGHIRQITYYPRRLANSELQAITS